MKRLLRAASLATVILASCAQPDARQAQLKILSSDLTQQFGLGPVPVRYNPVDCDCPPFEVKSSRGWVRIQFGERQDLPEEVLPLLEDARKDLANGELSTFSRRLDLDSSTPRFCANGTPYFRVELLVD